MTAAGIGKVSTDTGTTAASSSEAGENDDDGEDQSEKIRSKLLRCKQDLNAAKQENVDFQEKYKLLVQRNSKIVGHLQQTDKWLQKFYKLATETESTVGALQTRRNKETLLKEVNEYLLNGGCRRTFADEFQYDGGQEVPGGEESVRSEVAEQKKVDVKCQLPCTKSGILLLNNRQTLLILLHVTVPKTAINWYLSAPNVLQGVVVKFAILYGQNDGDTDRETLMPTKNLKVSRASPINGNLVAKCQGIYILQLKSYADDAITTEYQLKIETPL